MTAQRILLIFGSLLVVGLVLGLVFALRADAPRQPSSTATATAPPERPVQPPPRTPVSPTPPSTPAPQTSAPEPSGPPIVRDHRGQGPSAPPSVLAAETVKTIRLTLEPELRACAEGVTIPTGDPPHIYGHATINVTAGRIVARDFQITGADTLGQGYQDCVRRAFEGLSATASAEQSDGEDILHLPIRLP